MFFFPPFPLCRAWCMWLIHAALLILMDGDLLGGFLRSRSGTEDSVAKDLIRKSRKIVFAPLFLAVKDFPRAGWECRE